MRRAIVWSAIGATVGATASFAFGLVIALGAYRGGPGNVPAASVAVATVLALLGATAGTFIGATTAGIVFLRSSHLKAAPGPEEDYREPPAP